MEANSDKLLPSFQKLGTNSKERQCQNKNANAVNFPHQIEKKNNIRQVTH